VEKLSNRQDHACTRAVLSLHETSVETALMVTDFPNEYFSDRLPVPDGSKALEQAKTPSHLVADDDETDR
jgi:hypothetical protein